jgi:hypothetical protein
VYFKDFAPSDEQDVESDEMGLLDHRRPVFQGGDDTADNLQIFCQPCNNIKNTVCRRCPYNYNCDACSWAFPEKVRSRRVVLVLDQGMIDTLKTRYGNNIESKVIEDLKRLYEKD